MYAAYRLRADEITKNFFKGIKDACQDGNRNHRSGSRDETAYLLKSEANRRHLLKGLEEMQSGAPLRTMPIEQLGTF